MRKLKNIDALDRDGKNSESAQFYTRATKYKKNMEMTLKLQQTRVKSQDNSMKEHDENRPY